MTWWKGLNVKISKEKAVQINTLKEALNDFVQLTNRDNEAPLRLPLSGVYNIKGAGAF